MVTSITTQCGYLYHHSTWLFLSPPNVVTSITTQWSYLYHHSMWLFLSPLNVVISITTKCDYLYPRVKFSRGHRRRQTENVRGWIFLLNSAATLAVAKIDRFFKTCKIRISASLKAEIAKQFWKLQSYFPKIAKLKCSGMSHLPLCSFTVKGQSKIYITLQNMTRRFQEGRVDTQHNFSIKKCLGTKIIC